MTVYQIPGWDDHFENNKSRDIDECAFVAMPNKQHGMGLTRILAMPDGAATFGVWCLILQAASRQPRPRAGWLTDDGTPMGAPWDTDDMALRWRRPVEEVKRALETLCSTKVGWLKAYDEVPAECRPSDAVVPPDCRPTAAQVPPVCRPGAVQVPSNCPPTTLEGRKEGTEGREGKEARAGADAPPPVGDRIGTAGNRERLTRAIRKAGLAASEDAVTEWGAALTGRGRCETVDEVCNAIGWIGGKIAKGSHQVQYARQAGSFIDEWATVLDGRRARATELATKGGA